jgi:hypothetical protein
VALLPLFGALVLAAAAAGGIAVARRSPPSRETTVAAARRHASLTGSAALVLAAVAAVGTGVVTALPGVLAGPASTGVAALSVPLVFGLVHTAVLLLGELTWPRPEGDVRRARLARRGLLDAAPRWLVRLAGSALAGSLLVVVLGGLVAAPDGRSVGMSGAGGQVGGAASPFAGWSYGAPAATGLLALAAVSVAALWVVADRPAVVTADERIEAALRRASAHRVLRGATAGALVVGGGLLAVSGLSVRSAASGVAATAAANGLAAGPASAVLPWTGLGLALVGTLAVLGAAVLLTVRAPGVPADQLVGP